MNGREAQAGLERGGRPLPSACDRCLRRAFLLGHLAPRIADLLTRRAPRVPGLLALPEAELIAVAAGSRAEAAQRHFEELDPADCRAALERLGVVAACRHSGAYPAALLGIADPPAVLFAAGDDPRALSALCDEPSVAIVGTRRPSPYGAEVARALGRGLAVAGVHVVSGLALGIDATAHRGCLEAAGSRRGLPVAVMACGPDVAYPRRHLRLQERVRAEGVVLSELPPGTPAFRWGFPARNRVMAGIAQLTLVVEAADPSGSLITADFARDAGRPVAAVPGRVTARMARGTNALLRDGAIPITSVEDVLDELFGVGIRPERAHSPEPGGANDEPADPADRAVLAAVGEAASVGALARIAGLPAPEVRAALGRLEAGGLLVRDGFGGWERALR